jgi:hypothetical protein
VFAAAEADLQPDVAHRRFEQRRRVYPTLGQIDPYLGKQFLKQPLAAGPEGPAFPSAIKNALPVFSH